MTDASQDVLCVAAPGLSPGTWGAGCGTAADALRDGTGALQSYSAADPHHVLVVDILPAGATATIQQPGRQPRRLPVPDGVLATVAPTSAQITTNIAGRVSTIDLQPASPM